MNALTKFKDAENILGVCRHNLICELRRICKVIPIVDIYTRDTFDNFRINGGEIYLLRGALYNSFTVPAYLLEMTDEELKEWQVKTKLSLGCSGYPMFGGTNA